MVPQEVILSTTSSSSVPVSPSMFQHEKINNKKNGDDSYDDFSIINDKNNDNADIIQQNIKQQKKHRRYSFSRPSLRDMSNNNNESLGYSDDNNLIDLTSEKALQLSNETNYSYPNHQQEVRDESSQENDTADVPSDIADYKSNNNNNNEQSKEDDKICERGNPAACIFVASLTKGKNDEELNISVSKHFEQWGSLLNVKVLKDWMGRPYAFVQFERTQDANIALSQAPGTLLDGRNIRCEPARVNRTLSISSCGPPLILQEIQIELAEFGKIEDITVLHNYPLPTTNNDGNSIGDCVFVRYCYRDDAVKAFLTLSKLNQKWWVEWASNLDTTMGKHNIQAANTSDLTLRNNGSNGNNNKNEQERSFSQERVNVFIGNLFDDITEKVLKERFEHYGNILDLRIIRKTLPFKRVFAFIRFKEYAEAKKAIQTENGMEWHSRKLRVSYREPRETSIGFGLNRRMTMERPHPPGLGFPASEHQYIVSNTNNIKKNISSATSTSLNNKLKVEENKVNKGNNSNNSSTVSTNRKKGNGEKDKRHQHMDEKTAADNNDEQRQQQKSLNSNYNNKASNTAYQQHQSQQCIDNNNLSSLPIIPPLLPPPLHNVGMNRGYMKLPPGGDHLYHSVTHRQPHYMPPTIYDPNMYPPPSVMNPKIQQQQTPMMFGSVQDAGATTFEGNTISAQAALENNLIFVPGHYDYASNIYYGPCYHSISPPLLTNGPPAPPPFGSSSTTTSSTSPVTPPPVDIIATNAIHGMFGTNSSSGTNTISDNYKNHNTSSMRRTPMNNKNGVTPTASGYYYMMPPPPVSLHQHGHIVHNHSSMYHHQMNNSSAALHQPYHHPMDAAINNCHGDYNKYTKGSHTTSIPLSPISEQSNKQQQQQCTHMNLSATNKKGRTDSTKKVTITSPTSNKNKLHHNNNNSSSNNSKNTKNNA